jgi:DNA polymerase III delta prime subunit
MKISNDIRNLIFESYIINDKTISVDLDKFESGKLKKLLISGLSGSGKTTLGKILSKKYNCLLIDTDDINTEISKKYPDDKFPSSIRLPIFKDKFLQLLNNNEKMIITGIGISRIFEKFPDYNYILLKQAFIFLGKSALKGAWDAAIRESNNPENSKLEFFSWLYKTTKWNFSWFYDREIKLRNKRCSITNSNIQEFVVDDINKYV